MITERIREVLKDLGPEGEIRFRVDERTHGLNIEFRKMEDGQRKMLMRIIPGFEFSESYTEDDNILVANLRYMHRTINGTPDWAP